MPDTLITAPTAAVKSSEADPYKLDRMYLVLFSSPDDPDMVGDFFTAKTDFGDHRTSAVYWVHGLDPTLKKQVIGSSECGIDVKGVWLDTQLDKANKYAKDILKLVAEGKVGLSSGTASHLVERRPVKNDQGKVVAYEILKWPLGLDASLTPTPCEPRTRPDLVSSIKSFQGPTFKSLTEGEAGQVDGSSALTDTGLGDYTYAKNPMVGHSLAAKLADDHSDVVSRMFRNRTILPAEYDHISNHFGAFVKSFHAGIDPDVRDREMKDWDGWEVAYKALEGPGMKTVGDALSGCMIRAYNAGADHSLTRGYLTSEEHDALRDHFVASRDAYIKGLDNNITSRELKSNGTSYLAMKSLNGEDLPPAGKTVADETFALLADADGLTGRASRLKSRFADIREHRLSGDNPRDLGPKAISQITDTLVSLKSLIAEFESLVPSNDGAEKVAAAKAFLATLGS